MLGRESNREGFSDLLRGSLIRVKSLGSVILSITGGDDGRKNSEMHEVVFGDQVAN